MHFPVEHPEFRYAPSQNPYWHKLRAPESLGRAYVDHAPETLKGTWRSRFSTPLPPEAPIHVEIGCNAGHVIVERAAESQATLESKGWFGVDWKFKPIFRGMEKARARGLERLIFLRVHAQRLHYVFAPGEVSEVALYFPDPWPKKSQWKHRLVQKDWLIHIAGILKESGVLHIKTDHRGYYEWMLKEIEKCGPVWEMIENNADLHRNHPDPRSLKIPEVTLFERLFIKDGLPIHSIRLRKKP